MWLPRRVLVPLLAALGAVLAWTGAGTASQPLYDANVQFASLKVNGKGEALVTYRRNRCAAYDGPPLALLVAACKAPDGTYWAVQAWQRRLPNLGFDPWLSQQTNVELHVSHWSGELPELAAYAHWTYNDEWQGIFGRLTYLGKAVYGFGATTKGAPKDGYGRNVYVDTLNSVYGQGWKREAGILTHKGTGTFCHSFVPQHPFPGYPSQQLRPPAPGERYRVTVSGPGVMPVLQVEVPGLTAADRSHDNDLSTTFDRVMAGDHACAAER